MRKRIKFPLEMDEGVEVRSLKELQEHFSLLRVMQYAENRKLAIWLSDHNASEMADAVAALDAEDAEFARKLCELFGVSYEEQAEELRKAEERKREETQQEADQEREQQDETQETAAQEAERTTGTEAAQEDEDRMSCVGCGAYMPSLINFLLNDSEKKNAAHLYDSVKEEIGKLSYDANADVRRKNTLARREILYLKYDENADVEKKLELAKRNHICGLADDYLSRL